MKMIDKNIFKCKEEILPNKEIFLETLKKEWKEIPENIKTKLIIILFVADRYMSNVFTSMAIVKYYTDWKITI